MSKYGFGIDIGGTTVKIGLFQIDGTLLEKWEIKTRTENNGNFILTDIAEEVNRKIQEKSIDKSDVVGAGLGVPGPVSDDGTVLKCVNLGWGIFNVENTLGELTGLKVKAGNDANVAALGEQWLGGGSGYNNMVMVTLGTGVGGGIIIDGKMVAGSHGAGGEIGHIPVKDDETLSCGCGKKGCLEQYASATGIARSAKEYLGQTEEPSSLRDLNEITAKDIFDAAKSKDAVAVKLVEAFGKILGKALATISCVSDAEAYVIGGGVSKAGDIIIETTQKYFKQYAFHASRETTKFHLAKLGNDAGMYGAMKLVLD